jgi:DNA-binding NarL/FixJ family response regulator
MDKVIRILVANRPKLMRELILATLADEPGIEIVGEVSDDAEIPARVDETLPDLLVIALDEPGKRPQICDAVLRDHPQVRIIAVASEQNRSTGYWASFDIHSDDIEPSEAGILNAVRSMATGVGGGS